MSSKTDEFIATNLSSKLKFQTKSLNNFYIADRLNLLVRSLEIFINAFRKLRRAGTKHGPAPHKPILLLTFIELFDKGVISENRVLVDADLVGTFKENWELLVPTLHQPDFTLPFFYLQNDKASGMPFWFLKPRPGSSITKHTGVTKLAEICEYGFFSLDLFVLLARPGTRTLLKEDLLRTFFANDNVKAFIIAKSKGIGYFSTVESEILNEPTPRIIHIDRHIDEDRFVRNGSFKKNVLNIYNRTCSFTGMNMESTFSHAFIDACHIVPFALTVNDNVTNGIALCPNLHRAFDRGMIGVDDTYQIIVSKHLIESSDHPYSLIRLEGSLIRLPSKLNQYPSKEHLSWHRANIFKS